MVTDIVMQLKACSDARVRHLSGLIADRNRMASERRTGESQLRLVQQIPNCGLSGLTSVRGLSPSGSFTRSFAVAFRTGVPVRRTGAVGLRVGCRAAAGRWLAAAGGPREGAAPTRGVWTPPIVVRRRKPRP